MIGIGMGVVYVPAAAAGGGASNTQLLVPFDGDPLTADDQSANGLVATIGSAAALQSTTTRFGLTDDGAAEFTPVGANDPNARISYPGDDADVEPGAGAFTFEGHVRFKDLTNGFQALLYKFEAVIDGRSVLIERSNANLECTLYDDGESLFVSKVEAFTWLINTWYHWAVTRDEDDDLRIFVEGVQLGTPTAAPGTIFDSDTAWSLGSTMGSSGRSLDGFADNVRITIGEALYVANFTPPSAPFAS